FLLVLVGRHEQLAVVREQAVPCCGSHVHHRFGGGGSIAPFGKVVGRIVERTGLKEQHSCLQRQCSAFGGTADVVARIFRRQHGGGGIQVFQHLCYYFFPGIAR